MGRTQITAVLGLGLSFAVGVFCCEQARGDSFKIPGNPGLIAHIERPQFAPPGKKLPTLLIFGGFKEASETLELLKPLLRDEVALASFDYPFSPPRKFEFPASLKFVPEVKAMTRQTVSGIRAMYAALQTREDVDSAKIAIVGASFGAPFALEAASLEPTLSRLAIVHGFGDVPGTAMHQLLRKWQPRYGWLSYIPSWLIANLGWWYIGMQEPEESARALSENQKVLLVSAAEDSFIPREASESLWSALQESKAASERRIMPGDHLQPGSDQLIAQIMSQVVDWLDRGGWGLRNSSKLGSTRSAGPLRDVFQKQEDHGSPNTRGDNPERAKTAPGCEKFGKHST